MILPPASHPERLHRVRAEVSALAGSTPERQVRPLREAVELVAAGDASDADALLDAVEAFALLLTRAEAQLSGLERSVRDDLERAASLASLRTASQLASAADAATAGAAARSLLLDADEARAAGARHDPAAILVLLLDADAALDTVVAGYRGPRAQAERQLLLFEAARTVALLGADAVHLLGAVHGERVTDAPRILAEETRAQLSGAARRAAGDPLGALELARAAAERARTALDEALVDLDGVPPARGPSPIPGSSPAA
ncbi:hypothetical protein [Rathayibacter tanaceti]|uniref:Uncharacterized protein n=1 Tax=Rathayibacter tanaceti TaxID=1671680 RepID=A0AAE6RIC7_9MICO|nr:hypothetical protein [Rathayibacter tanaceti]QHC55015.1 hypothetical protein GSU10_04745 [Rathayibacter tanaceti]